MLSERGRHEQKALCDSVCISTKPINCFRTVAILSGCSDCMGYWVGGIVEGGNVLLLELGAENYT